MIILSIILIVTTNKATNKATNICNMQLTDDEYINHMITHHEVAVYMSVNHLQNTKNPIILDILRYLIKTQNYEIDLMKYSKITNKTNLELNHEMSNNNITMDSSYRYTLGDFTKPNTPYLSNVFCDPGFFTISHNKNLHNMTDTMYI